MWKFFLDRPILSIVLSLTIVIAGLAALRSLPVEQYPKMTPPMILVTTKFAGATAETIAAEIAGPLERSINGVENMIYMYSQSASPGTMNLYVYFDVGTDPDMALINTQTRVTSALPGLPAEVRQTGVTVVKSAPDILQFIAIEDPAGLYDDAFVINYATNQIVEELKRVKGVSQARVLNGRDYSMRIWLKPDRLAQFNLSTDDVLHAIRAQNALRRIGEIGQEPSVSALKLTIPVSSLARFTDVTQFENIILRAEANGGTLLLKDVGYIELGAKNYDLIGDLNGKSGAFIAVYKDGDSNALSVAKRVQAKLTQLKEFFPYGLKVRTPYDPTKFIRKSIKEILKTILEAAVLVSLVMLIFLQSIRAAIIPIVAMIVSIVGTFAGMYLFGYSLNILSLFGMVLAVGIVVDDAIVVVENIDYNIKELKMGAYDAAIKTLKDVAGPVIAIVCALCSVFIPVAFIGGIPGQFYRQFALTIVISVTISGFVALTLSPVLAILLLKEGKTEQGWFGRWFGKMNNAYLRVASSFVERKKRSGVLCFAILSAIVFLLSATPLGFVPEEDQGYLLVNTVLPDGASLSRTQEVVGEVEKIAKATPGVQDVLSFSGYSLLDSIPRNNYACHYVILDDWKKRKAPGLHERDILRHLEEQFNQVPKANIDAIAPPSVPGIGVATGFTLWVCNQTDYTNEQLEAKVQEIIGKGKEDPAFHAFIAPFRTHCMQLVLNVDPVKAKALDVDIDAIYNSLQVLLGSTYVNDFTKYGRLFEVIAHSTPKPLNQSSIDKCQGKKREKMGAIYFRFL